jgi:hypothetical protein
MKKPFLSNPIKSLQVGIFCLVICANLALLLGLLAVFAHMIENHESARLFAGASLLATLESLWLGMRAARARVFLNYKRAAQVYYPGIIISIVLALLAHLMMTYSWDVQSPFWIIIFTISIFMVVCLSIKLSNSRHAFD